MKKTTKRLIFWSLFLAGCTLAFWVVVCSQLNGPWRTNYNKARSDYNMHLLASGVEAYRADFGRFPNRLADLAPKYVDMEKELGFYVRTMKPPENLVGVPEVIEAFLPYFYIPLKQGRYVIAERQGTWSDGTMGYVLSGEKADDPFSGTKLSAHHRVTTDEFMRLLAEGFPFKESPHP